MTALPPPCNNLATVSKYKVVTRCSVISVWDVSLTVSVSDYQTCRIYEGACDSILTNKGADPGGGGPGGQDPPFFLSNSLFSTKVK